MTAEERMMWVERYSALPTGNVADAMDGLGLKRGSVLGLHPIDPSQKRAAGFARTVLQKRRSTPWDGVQGELTDGCLRDTDDIAAFGFPAYSAGTAPNKSAYDIETVGVDVPVTLCGVLIFPGDMVVMDRTGVVVVPSGKIAEVYESAFRIAKREERVAVHLREGKTLTESRKLAAAEVGQ